MKNLKFLLFFISINCFAQKTFEVGSGSQFKLTMQESLNANLNIYISESSLNQLGVEYFFTTDGILGQKMWQQFIFKVTGEGPLQINAGYVKTPDMTFAESLFAKKEQLTKFLIKEEKIEVPAGFVLTQHYRKERNGQVVDFWISPVAMPIGLVKLISSSKTKVEHNYKIELLSLLKKVKAEIDPLKSKPLSDKGKAILAKPLKK
jgi:hypothetical protein